MGAIGLKFLTIYTIADILKMEVLPSKDRKRGAAGHTKGILRASANPGIRARLSAGEALEAFDCLAALFRPVTAWCIFPFCPLS